MSRQSLIVNYFKTKAATPSTIHMDVKYNPNDFTLRKHKLSLNKPITPTKTPKVSYDDINIRELVDLCSDDEEISTHSKLKVPCIDLSQVSNESDEAFDSSGQTILYSLSPRTPQKTPQVAKTQNLLQTAGNLQKTPLTPGTSEVSSFRSPSFKEKFFSPSKKRAVVKRSPVKISRKLCMEMPNTQPCNSDEDELFTAACEGMDDKTIFLLTIINKFLNEASIRHLLDIDAWSLLTNCLQAIKPGMRLVCRLYWRKEGWYKRKQITSISCEEKETMDEACMQTMINSLVENGLIVKGDNRNMTFDDFKAVLNREELMQICKELKLKIHSKQEAIDALAGFSKRSSNISNFLTGCTSNNSRRVLQIMFTKTGPCYKLSDTVRTTLHKLYLIMYLGMHYDIIRERKLELTLIYDKIKRETYPVDKEMELDNASVVFKNKDDFERYFTAHNIYEDYLTRTDFTDKCNIVKQVYNFYKDIDESEMTCYKSLPTWLRRYTPAYLCVKILESGIQDLKRDKTKGHYLLCLNILNALIAQAEVRQHKKADWYAEKALILHNILYRWDEAAEVLLEGFDSNVSEEAKDSLRPRARKIANQKNTTLSAHLQRDLLEHATKEAALENNLSAEHIYKQPMDRTSKRGKVKFETRTHEGRMIQEAEEYCIAHYVCTGDFTHGEHWEGKIVTTLFFLLFWDIVYSKPRGVRGVFLSHYQRYPLDLFSGSFYENRKAAIDDWLEAIENATEHKLLAIMQDTWNSRPEYELSGIARSLGWENVRTVASCLGPRVLAAICRRLATNYHYASTGFPDLTLWHAHTKHIKFVEVKTDSDKPSMKQVQWMQYLRRHGVDTEFCYLGVNTTRQRCRPKARPTPALKTEP